MHGFLHVYVRVLNRYVILSIAGRHVGMADEADSKSVVGNHVWVQVPLPALVKKGSRDHAILFLTSVFLSSTEKIKICHV